MKLTEKIASIIKGMIIYNNLPAINKTLKNNQTNNETK